MVGTLGWFSSPEVGIISLVVFLVLSITLLALCARCNRGSSNAYDVSGTTHSDKGAGANGTTVTKSGVTVDSGTTSWRDHRTMPPNTLERPHAATH